MKLSIANLCTILELLNEGKLLYRKISSKKFLKYFENMHAINIHKNISPIIIDIKDEKRIFALLSRSGCEVSSKEELVSYIDKLSTPQTRDEISNNNKNTKSIQSPSFKGLNVSVLRPLEVFIKGKEQTLMPLEGCSTFLHFASPLTLQKDTIVVGVENYQTLLYILRYKHLFNDGKDYMFLLIKNINTSFERDWLESLKNDYLHFGDYDLAAISIYLNEICPKLKQSSHSYFINDFILKKIENGDRELYSKQIIQYRKLESKDKRVQKLINFINTKMRSVEQEALTLGN